MRFRVTSTVTVLRFPRSKSDRWITQKVASASQLDGDPWPQSPTGTVHMLVEIGDTPTPNGQKSNCLNDRSGKLNQLGTNPLSLSLLPLFFHPPPRRQKLQASDSFFLSLADCRRGGIRMEWPRLPGFAFPLFSLPPSRGTISRLTGARKKRVR